MQNLDRFGEAVELFIGDKDFRKPRHHEHWTRLEELKTRGFLNKDMSSLELYPGIDLVVAGKLGIGQTIGTRLPADSKATGGKIGYMVMPVYGKGKFAGIPLVDMQGLGISSNAEDPQAAAAFLENLNSPARLQDFWHKTGWFPASTSLMAVPPVVMIVPLFLLYAQLRLICTFAGAIIIYAGLITPFSVYLLTTFFRTVQKELYEAARMDGAGSFLILWKIVLPLSLPALVTLPVVNSLYVWNDLLIAIIFLQDDAKRTLMAGISVFQGHDNNQVALTMAGMVIAGAPMFILYLAFQKHFIRGMMAGAIK